MKIKYKLEKSIAEAKLFIDAAEDAISDIDSDLSKQYRSKEVAKAKRRSMDLSNQLVDLRDSSTTSY